MTAESRSVVVRLTMEASSYIRESQRAGKEGTAALTKIEVGAKRAGTELDTLGGKAGKVGLAAAGGLAAVGKAAVDWQSQWAGVTKTVDGTTSQMAQLEDGLRGLATTLPATHQEIAGVAEAAGQLGVAREDILDFTETMVALGETTNLTAQDAATNIAQIANVMGTTGDEVDNLGAALVALGNDGASTEKQILDMTQRIAGAGAQIGLAESEILAIANAAASMGIEAEAGGSAISRVFTELAKATSQGGPQLEAFAAVANTSAQEFARAFETDPARAFASFTQGLDRINKSGGDVFTVLDDLGLADVRVSQALLGMAASGDLLTDSLNLGAKAWEENTALSDEFAKRLGTTGSQVRTSFNNIRDAAIDVGSTLLPMIETGAELASDLANAIGSLPEPMQGFIGKALVLTTIVGGAAWFGTKVVGGITTARSELKGLALEAPRTASALGKVATVGPALLVVGTAVGALADNINRINASDIDRTFDAFARGAKTDDVDQVVSDLKNLESTLNAIDFGEIVTLGGAFGDTSLDRAADNVEQFDQKLASLAESGEKAQAALIFDKLVKESGLSAQEAAARFDTYTLALENLTAKEREAAIASGEFSGGISSLLTGPLGDVKTAAGGAADAVGDLEAKITHLNEVLSGRASLRDYEASIDAIGEAIDRNGRGLNIDFAGGRDNQAALDAIAASAAKVAETMKGTAQVRFLERARQDFIEARVALRGTGESADVARAKARLLADELGLVGQQKPKPKVEVEKEQAEQDLTDIQRHLLGLDQLVATPRVDVKTADSETRLRRILEQMRNVRDKDVYLRVHTQGPARHMGGDVLAGPGIGSARGNFLPAHAMAYAGGGIDRANAHRPEIADGRMIRIWNEPETGGESYIPHANDSRRPRAKNILEQTANLFGGTVNWYAHGAVVGGAISSGGGTTVLDIDYDRLGRTLAAMRPLTIEDKSGDPQRTIREAARQMAFSGDS